MRSFATVVAVAASIISINALNIPAPVEGRALKVVQHQIQRRDVSAQHIGRRQSGPRSSDTVLASLSNKETLYFIQTYIGTPGQLFALHIDTGSSDLWVNVPNSQFCEERTDPCSRSGTFNPNESSTYHYVNSDFKIEYEDGTGAEGVYATDTVSFAGITIENQQIGIGYESTTPQSLMGIGYPSNEVQPRYDDGQTYANVPASLAIDGFINTNAYSLFLNDLEASTGTILFGGVNQAKYTGSLETLPIIPRYGEYVGFFIALTAIGTNGNEGSVANNIKYPALLDSGTSLTLLPDSYAEALFEQVGATWDSATQLADIDCSQRDLDFTIEFTFSSPTIQVPMSELVVVLAEGYNYEKCVFGVSKAGSGPTVLGDTFLRSAYVVYDIDNNQISIAQTQFDSTEDDIVEITKTSGVPGATYVSNAVSSVPSSAFGGEASTGPDEGTVTSSASPVTVPALSLVLLGALTGSVLMASI